MLVKSSQANKRLEFTEGNHNRDFSYVEKVAEGLLRVGVSGAEQGSVINIATGNLTSIRSYIEIAAKDQGIDERRLDFVALPTHGSKR